MPKVPISELKPGMKLLKAVTSPSGMVLLSDGTELNEELIGRLARMELEGVHVRGERRPGRSLEAMLTELDARFAKTEHEPLMADLKAVFREHIAGWYAHDGL